MVLSSHKPSSSSLFHVNIVHVLFVCVCVLGVGWGEGSSLLHCIVLKYIGSVRNSPRKVTCPEGKQVEKVACPP